MTEPWGCRSCGASGLEAVLDLGAVPGGSDLALTAHLAAAAPAWPLRAWVCGRCGLLQLDDSGPEEGFDVSGVPAYRSPTLERHTEGLVAAVLARLASPDGGDGRPAAPRILEVASHSGYVQPAFEAAGVGTLVVERSPERAEAARRDGRTVAAPRRGTSAGDWLVAAAGGAADVVVDAFLLAHLRDPVGLLRQVRDVLAPGGCAVFELADVRPMIEQAQFDSFRHGHFSYFSFTALGGAMAGAGLGAFDVEAVPLYGGSMRVWAQAAESSTFPVSAAVAARLEDERRAGLDDVATFTAYRAAVDRTRGALHEYLEAARLSGRRVAGYGAPSRATTLLAASGVTPELLPFTVDRSPGKHGSFLPGSAIPVREPAELLRARPDDVLVLTWDLASEVVDQLPEVLGWGGRFVVPIPDLRVVAGPGLGDVHP